MLFLNRDCRLGYEHHPGVQALIVVADPALMASVRGQGADLATTAGGTGFVG
jgi:hypothetical protein